jgi:hypothetical protein
MAIALTLPALVLLASAPSVSGLPQIPGLNLLKGLRTRHAVVHRDTIPPPWRSASQLALARDIKNATMLPAGPPGTALILQPYNDPRTLRVDFDLDSAEVVLEPVVGNVSIDVPRRVGLDAFASDLSRRTAARLWSDKSIQNLNSLGSNVSTYVAHSGLSFALPSPLPARVQSLLGPGGPALNVSGSENISLSGQSNWTNQQVGLLGQRKSLFPTLDMQQNLDIRLEGQLSDRIKVNLFQNSLNQVPLSNRIAINYKGDEDDLVQEFDMGNTNLSLPGTQYVSYSGQNEGLFGLKAASRVGPLDFTVLASKQEGRSERASYGGGAAKQNASILDADYVRDTYFFLYDPNRTPTMQIDEATLVVYLDNATITNDANRIRGRAFVDPNGADTTSVRGSFRQLNGGADHDFEVVNLYGPNFKVLRLKAALTPHSNQCLAVTYLAHLVDAKGNPTGAAIQVGGEDVTLPDGTVERRMKLIRTPDILLATQHDPAPGSPIFYADTGAFNVTRDLELKNLYQLDGQRIDPKSFTLSIRKGTDQPYKTAIQFGADTSISYLEAVGLDSYDESGGIPVFGKHDNHVDGTTAAVNNQLHVAVDFENGILFLPDPHPFAPRLGQPATFPFDSLVGTPPLVSRRSTLTGSPTDQNSPNPQIYNKLINEEYRDAMYYMDVAFTAASVSNEIQLGRGNILPGSVTVSVNGIAWAPDKDYTVDYDIGRVVLKRQVGPSDNLNIDYSYAPLFQQAGRTLIGSAFRLEGRDKAAGGAFMYESHGAQDLRPRLGEEPSRSVIGDLNGDWLAHPSWMTHLADRLPGVRTTTPSDFHVQAEIGASFPNPNTKNEIYIDDMEGVRDATSLSLASERWHWSSVPSRLVNGLAEPVNSLSRVHNGEVHWYVPPNVVKAKDLKPTLTQAQGGDLPQTVLAISVPRRPTSANNDFVGDKYDSLWAGLTYLLDPVGLDLSRSQFIELWVDDFNDYHDIRHPEPRVRGRHLKLHIDIGRVSEDMQRAPDEPPNGKLDTEDQNRDGQLQVSGDLFEDTGYDGKVDPANATHPGDIVESGAPRDLTTVDRLGPGTDPEGDTWSGPDGNFTEIDPRRYRYTNGTEGNRNVNGSTPDTEDLNLNGNLDTNESYFEYTIDLGDTSSTYRYLAPGGDLQKELPPVPIDNGWRRYRIPIADSLRQEFGANPNLTFAQHVRLWVEGIVNPDPDPDSLGGTDPKTYPVRPLLMLGSLDIVGSRWQVAALDSGEVARGATVTLNSVNSVDNSNIYTPPFDPGQTLNGSQSVARREQSLALEFESLAPGDSVEAYRTFTLDEDYSRYGDLNWYTAGYAYHQPAYPSGVDSLDYYVRFSSDENEGSYYEYRAPLPASSSAGSIHWDTVRLALTTLSNLKLNPGFPRTDPVYYVVPGDRPGVTYRIRGRPSFTRLRRIAVGVVNRSALSTYPGGQLWYDELRATDVAKDVGQAERVLVNGRMANLLSYNLTYNGRNADFMSVGETRGLGYSASQLSLGGNVDLHRFFEGTGLVMPLGFAYATSTQRPRYSAGDDVVRTDQQAAASETHTETRSWSTSIARQWSARSNPFLRFALSGLSASFSRSHLASRNPSSVDSSTTTAAGVNYGITPRSLLSLPMPGTRVRFFPLPERLYWNYSVATNESRSYDRLSDSTRTLVPRSLVNGRSASIAFGGDFRPVDLLHEHFEGVRNLLLGPLNQTWGFINIGHVVTWRQSLDAHYTLNRGLWLRPNLGWGASYSQNNGPELSPDLSVRAVSNGQNLTMTWALPFDKLAAPALPAPHDTTHRASPAVSPVRRVLSRLGEIGTEASVSTNSGYSRLTGTPSFAYLFGLSSNPGFNSDTSSRVQPAFGNVFGNGLDWRTAAHTRILLGLASALNTRAEYTSHYTNQNTVEHLTLATHFPDFDVDYGRVASAIRLDRILRDPHLRTGYSRSSSQDFQGSDGVKIGIASSDAWSPLIGIDGSLKNGARAEIKLGTRSTHREDLLLGRSVTDDRNTDFSLNLTRTYSQGQKVNILGKQTTVRSTVTLGMAATYSRHTGSTHTEGELRDRFPIGEDRLDVKTDGSYGFSNNVTGNMTLGFSQTRDLLRDITRRNIRVELRGQFTF